MTAREKFHAIMSFEPGAPCMKTEFGYWAATIRRWRSEGLPIAAEVGEDALDGDLVRGSTPFGIEASITGKAGTRELVDTDVMSFFGLESHLAKFPFDLSPRLPHRVLEEDERHRLFTDGYGATKLVTKENAATWHVVNHPIKTRRDMSDYFSLYDSSPAQRLPPDTDRLAASLKGRDYPIRLGGEPFGFTYLPRALMGDVAYMTTLHDDPEMIRQLNEFFLRLAMDCWAPILTRIDIDCAVILEDVAYRSGSMISPTMYDEFAVPYTRRFVDFLRQFGVTCILVDCDGKIDTLLPLWVKAGITGLFPIEAVNDIIAIRDSYPRLQLVGGVDKRPLISGRREAIDAELARIAPLLDKGGFIPHIDHAVPADISLASFTDYRRRLNDMIDERRTG